MEQRKSLADGGFKPLDYSARENALIGTPPARQRKFHDMSSAEKLDVLTDMALVEAHAIFSLPVLPDELEPLGLDATKVRRMKLELVQTIGSLRVKVDSEALRHQDRRDLLDTIRDRLDKIKLPQKT